MAQNPTIVRLTGGGTWTVPAGVKQVWIYSEFNGVSSIAGSDYNSYIRSQSGRVYSFGDDANGQLGNGVVPFADTSTPYAVVAGNSFVQVANGLGSHVLGLEADGSVYAWGYNGLGQLGDNTVVSKSTPVPVSGSQAFIQIAAGGYHSLALKANGSVYAWGSNGPGQLGDNTIVAKSSPVLVFSTNTTVPISDLSGSTMRRIYDVTPGDSISYKIGKSPNYFGNFVIASDITEILLQYYE